MGKKVEGVRLEGLQHIFPSTFHLPLSTFYLM